VAIANSAFLNSESGVGLAMTTSSKLRTSPSPEFFGFVFVALQYSVVFCFFATALFLISFIF